MKKYFYFFLLSIFWGFSLNVQATDCGNAFNNILQRVKRYIGQGAGSSGLVPSILLKELNHPQLSVQSILRHPNGMFYGEGIIPLFPKTSSELQKGQPEYVAGYVPSKSWKVKGSFVLSFRIVLDTKTEPVYQHWIYWPSSAKKVTLSSDMVKEVFNAVYRETYGDSLEWMIEKEVISKTIDYNDKSTKEQFGISQNQFGIYDIFNLNLLLFRDAGSKLKHLIIESLTHSDQISSNSKKQESLDILSDKMSPGMRNAVLRSYTIEQLKDLHPEQMKNLSLSDIIELFNTSEKIQMLDMSLLPSEIALQLLAEYSLWRESITPSQLKQLDVSGNGIQYVLVPTFKHFTWRSSEERAIINIDNLSNEQVMSLNRDVFLRDVFLVGELFVEGVLPLEVANFITARKMQVKELGSDVVMSHSVPKKMRDIILQELGFNLDFESMTPKQRRELFKKEIEMMTDISQQISIVTELIRINEQENHNWF